VLTQAKPHMSDEHFTVEGTLIEAWASQKSFQKKDGGDEDPGQFRAQKRSNDTHESKTDPDLRLYRKGNGQEAKLGYLGHQLMENRYGLIADAMLTTADGTAERDAALLMMYRRWRKRQQQRRNGSMTVGADKAYDTKDFMETLRAMGVRPHVTQNVNRPGGSAIDYHRSLKARQLAHLLPEGFRLYGAIEEHACDVPRPVEPSFMSGLRLPVSIDAIRGETRRGCVVLIVRGELR
jgi:hypothetical protein